MDLVVELVKDRLDNYSTSENIIRSKTDLLITIGTEIIPDINSTRVSTTLLRSLRNFFYGEYTILISISLSLQAEILSEQCEDDYLLVVQQFMRIIDYDKAKYIHKDVANILRKCIVCAYNRNCMLSIVNTLELSIAVLSPSPVCLIPSHALLMEALVAGQLYSQAAEVALNSNIYEINTQQTSLSTLDMLKYFYYGAISFIALKDFSRALQYLNHVIAAPAGGISKVVDLALRKAKLVSLLLSGKAFTLPIYTPNLGSRYLNDEVASFEVYGNITQLFLDQKYEELSAFVTGHKDVLDKNNDYGLALQTCEHLLKVKIISLSKIYSAIRLSDLVAKVGVDPYKVEQILVSLILSGRIESSIDRPAGIAYFGSEQNPQKSDELIEEERMKLLEHQMQQSMLLSTHLKELQKNLYSSPRYILSNDKEFLTAIKSSSGADSLMDFH